MATLERNPFRSPTPQLLVDTQVPEPFPLDILQRERELTSLAQRAREDQLRQATTTVESTRSNTSIEVATHSRESEEIVDLPDTVLHSAQTLNDALPSLKYVYESCLVALNSLLSQTTDQPWQSIISNPRRHSMPNIVPITDSTEPATTSADSTLAIRTLVSNLRAREGATMLEVGNQTDEDLMNELVRRVEGLSSTGVLGGIDSQLAKTLASLLAYSSRVFDAHPSPSSAVQASSQVHDGVLSSPLDIYGALSRQVGSLQTKRQDTAQAREDLMQTPVRTVELALLWTRIDDALETVQRLCQERSNQHLTDLHTNPLLQNDEWEQMPPEYLDEYLPEYDPFADPEELTQTRIEYKASKQSEQSASLTSPIMDEKRKLDLDSVTLAIDRLYRVTPQLHNQRAELRPAKLDESELTKILTAMEKLSLRGRLESQRAAQPQTQSKAASRLNKRKEKEADLDRILELVGRTERYSIVSQRVEVVRDKNMKVQAVKQDELDDRVAGPSRVRISESTRTNEALLSLPEFMNEHLSPIERPLDPEALLTLPEFVKEVPPNHVALTSESSTSNNTTKGNATTRLINGSLTHSIHRALKGKSRSRSLSAPPLAWLNRSRPSSSGSGSGGTPSSSSPGTGLGAPRPPIPLPRAGLEARYVAEHQENLRTIQIYLRVERTPAGHNVEAEILPRHGTSGEMGDRLVLKAGSAVSAPLSLPALAVSGQANVHVVGDHLEIKLNCAPEPSPLITFDDETHATNTNIPPSPHPPLLDATELSSINPTSFICASCSLPLLHSTTDITYADLPSEHWAELVEAWMCHPDQKLNDEVKGFGARGFWPSVGKTLVGGSYLLVEEGLVVKANVKAVTDIPKKGDWDLVRCICGSLIGRRQPTPGVTASTSYRLAKYAIRPVSPTSDNPIRHPLAAYIVADIVELAQAHATYRVVVMDEEAERPRILIWLFNPSVRLTYSSGTQSFLSSKGIMEVAKVMFQVIGPSTPDADSLIEKHGFKMAEPLLYPMNVCRRLAALLKESNGMYPPARRAFQGLDVGWLHRG